MKFRMIAGLVTIAMVVSTLHGDDQKEISLDGVTCALNLKRPAKDVDGSSVDFKGGKVFFCCTNCPKAFSKGIQNDATADQLTAQGNWQLVATGQAVSTGKCPIAGRPINPKQKTSINGVEVSFCCPNCKGKVEDANDAKEKINIVFGDEKKFDAAFETPKGE